MSLTDWLASMHASSSRGPYPLAVAETPGSTDNLKNGGALHSLALSVPGVAVSEGGGQTMRLVARALSTDSS